MSKITNINSPVSVTALGFAKNMQAYPRRIEYDGSSYHFIDKGLRTVVSRGGRVAEILTMSDGLRDFYLRTDNDGGSWMLLGIG